MPKTKFKFDFDRYVDLLKRKSGQNTPGCFEQFGINPQLFYKARKGHANDAAVPPSILDGAQTAGFSLQELRSCYVKA